MTRRPAVLLIAVLALLAGALAPTYADRAEAAAPGPGATVLDTEVIGRSVQGRAIKAWRLGEPARRGVPTVVLLSTLHGDEGDTRQILAALRDGPPVVGVDLWVVPVVNPDGLARGTRSNARGVDLNRNFPRGWVDLDGRYESGPRPASEPETRAVMTFLDRVRPDRLLSFHQPLLGVDTDSKRPGFAREVARRLRLPTTSLTCGGVCHGTMTGWFNARRPGVALTVEYGARPARRTMQVDAPRQVLGIFGARTR